VYECTPTHKPTDEHTLTHLVNLVSDQHLDHVMFCRKSFQLTEPGIQLGEWLLAAYVVHWPRQEIRADVQFTDFENRKNIAQPSWCITISDSQNFCQYVWRGNIVKVGQPLISTAKESVSPALIPHGQSINRVRNSYLFIINYLYFCDIKNLNTVGHHILHKKKKKQQTFDTFLNRLFETQLWIRILGQREV